MVFPLPLFPLLSYGTALVGRFMPLGSLTGSLCARLSEQGNPRPVSVTNEWGSFWSGEEGTLHALLGPCPPTDRPIDQRTRHLYIQASPVFTHLVSCQQHFVALSAGRLLLELLSLSRGLRRRRRRRMPPMPNRIQSQPDKGNKY